MKPALVALFILIARSLNAQNPPPGALANVGIDQRLSDRIPLDIALRDETGRAVALREFFNEFLPEARVSV